MCGIDFFISLRFLKKSSDSVRNAFDSVISLVKKMQLGYYSYLLITTHVIAE